MEISRRRSLSSDFDATTGLPTASSYPPTYANCRANTYAIQGMKLPSESKISKPLTMQSSLSIDSATSVLTPKKENFFSSMFGALTSIVVERIAKVPGAFMSNINSTLSVTVVPNEGIISQDFFKNLTRSCEQLESLKEFKESMRINERMSNDTFYDAKSQLPHIFTDNATTFPLSHKVSINFNENTIESKEINEKIRDRDNKNELDINCTSSIINRENNDTICQNDELTMKNSNKEIVTSDDCEISMINSTEEKLKINESCSSRSAVPKIEENLSEAMTPKEHQCATRWHTMWQKVVNGMNDRFNPRSTSPEPEVPMKKPNLSSLRRKPCPMARGRGHKGRGKSQLRRSGVSQSRHRKERTKQNIYSNIQDDLEAWEDSEKYDESGDDELLQGTQHRMDKKQSPCKETDNPNRCSLFENFTIDETSKSRKRKQRTRAGSIKCPLRVRYVPESASMEVEAYSNGYIDEVDCNSRISDFRPRLVSESSVDSEDSYCIVFESGSDSEYTDYDYDAVTDEELNEDLNDDDKTAPRVRFNLEPQVHTMFQWDYAYRAARRGPWEQMARDRDRFRSRIHCIERILDPILSAKHRKCVWQDRFDVDH